MGSYILRRILTAIPTLFFISFVIFALLALSPGDPTGNLPPSLPMEIKQRVREALPLCVDVRVETRRDAEDLPQVELSSLTPTDLYTRYYQQAHGSAPTPETLAVFREVLEEATVQTS